MRLSALAALRRDREHYCPDNDRTAEANCPDSDRTAVAFGPDSGRTADAHCPDSGRTAEAYYPDSGRTDCRGLTTNHVIIYKPDKDRLCDQTISGNVHNLTVFLLLSVSPSITLHIYRPTVRIAAGMHRPTVRIAAGLQRPNY
jgi:hypothetical protein